jgi:hypothetical protein
LTKLLHSYASISWHPATLWYTMPALLCSALGCNNCMHGEGEAGFKNRNSSGTMCERTGMFTLASRTEATWVRDPSTSEVCSNRWPRWVMPGPLSLRVSHRQWCPRTSPTRSACGAICGQMEMILPGMHGDLSPPKSMPHTEHWNNADRRM